MIFTPYIIELLGKKCGRSIRIPADCEHLALDIESKTKVHIGATTLKRLTGLASDEREPHTTTLDAIARYLGYKNWKELAEIAAKSNSALDCHENETRSVNLRKGCKVEVTYQPNRRIVFTYLGENRYVVSDSINSKLQKGDTMNIFNFVLNHPFFAQDVQRDNNNLGEYTGAIISGITSIKITEE